MKNIHIVECPRDAMQGIKEIFSTQTKINYLNQLLKVGFNTLDFGSFVSPKAIPQWHDTKNIIPQLNLQNTKTKLLAIVANQRGAIEASEFDEISYIGYPFSISETFQLRNTGATIQESLTRVEEIQNICVKKQKTLVVYISMGFGNPYGDEYNPEIAVKWSSMLASNFDIKILSLSDTIGASTPTLITNLFKTLIPQLPQVQIGAHLHTTAHSWKEKVEAAYLAGCNRFDGALKGFGGCPMALDELVGNMPTENLISYFDELQIPLEINKTQLSNSLQMASQVFINH